MRGKDTAAGERDRFMSEETMASHCIAVRPVDLSHLLTRCAVGAAAQAVSHSLWNPLR